jgi:hypothetical protein
MNKKHAGLATAVLGTVGLVIFAQAAAATDTAIDPAFQDRQDNPQVGQRKLPPDFMGVAGVTGWVLAGPPRTFPKEGLYGYVDGGAEIFLQYGFRNLTVFELAPEKPSAQRKAITLEIFRMESPAAAFGIFSTRREGGEPVSPGIKTTHWIGREQTNLVKGDLYVNILATGCTQAEVEEFVFSLDRQLPEADAALPRAFSCMPEFNLVPGSERYICGPLAAANESPLLEADFWGFKEGLTQAYSAKYGPGLSKLIVLDFKKPPENLLEKVSDLFHEYLMDVSISRAVMQGKTVAGRRFYFGWNGPHGILITDEPDPNVARERIQEALDKAAKRLEEKSKEKTDGKKK